VIKPDATVRRSHVGHSVTDRKTPPCFFLSYVHDEGEDDASVEEFYRRLTHDVRLLSGRRTGDVGFCDVRLRAGEQWSTSLVESLSTAQVFLPIISPTYLASPACGKEWTVFTRRMNGAKSSSSPLLPLFWIPMQDPPAVIRRYQFRDQRLGEVYARQGLRALIQRGNLRDHFRGFVEALAARIVEICKMVYVPPALDRPAFDDIENAFQPSPVPEQRSNNDRTQRNAPVPRRRPPPGMPRLNPADPWPKDEDR
jgi:hypothetical protein